jgi:hypothetical protein
METQAKQVTIDRQLEELKLAFQTPFIDDINKRIDEAIKPLSEAH